LRYYASRCFMANDIFFLRFHARERAARDSRTRVAVRARAVVAAAPEVVATSVEHDPAPGDRVLGKTAHVQVGGHAPADAHEVSKVARMALRRVARPVRVPVRIEVSAHGVALAAAVLVHVEAVLAVAQSGDARVDDDARAVACVRDGHRPSAESRAQRHVKKKAQTYLRMVSSMSPRVALVRTDVL
jgi:hypothetical protein